MCRIVFALLLAALTALAAAHFGAPTVGAQDEKKDKPAPPASADKGDRKDDLSRVLPVFDPGSHTQPISALGFTADKKKLVTVGQDFTVQVWSAATGERLDILRLPGYGREKGFDPGRWDVAAVSADGTLVAVGGQPKFLSEADGEKGEPARLVVVHLPTRAVKRVGIRGNVAPVTALAFSPNGGSLAVGLGAGGKGESGLLVLGNLATRLGRDKAEMSAVLANVARTSGAAPLQALAFSPDGARVAGGFGTRLAVWDVPAGIAPKPKLVKEIEAEGGTHALDWSPDGKTFARAADGAKWRAVEVWTADGAREKALKPDDLTNVFTARGGRVSAVKFLDPATLYLAGHHVTEKRDGGAAVAGTVDLKTGKDRLLASVADAQRAEPLGCASADGTLVAVTAAGNVEARVAESAGGKWVSCGGGALPAHVGWAKDAAKPGFAWTDQWHNAKDGLTADVLDSGFDLTKVEPLGEVKPADYLPTLRASGGWALDFVGLKGDDERGGTQLKQNGKSVRTFPIARGIGQTLVPDGDKPPRVAYATQTENKGGHAAIYAADGTAVTAKLLPHHTRIHSMAASPDGRFLICTTGTPRVVVYRTDGSPYPLFSFARVNCAWVLWTPEGYYAASPGGEKLFGWAVNNGPNELVTFHPAEKFARHFHRPDVIKLTIEKGSVKDARAALMAPPPPPVETILPPTAKLELLGPPGATAKVRATAVPGAKGQPVLAMRVLLDGRPLADAQTAWAPAADGTATGECEVAIPPGAHELRVLARSADAAAVSDPVAVFGPPVAGQQPTLYRVCVGVSEYADPGLKLGAATNDARAIFEALEAHCVGPANRFGAAKGELIRDKDATRARVVGALERVQKAARPGDLVVVFFAGHGVSQRDPAAKADVYYLLTHEADVSKPLVGRALSGDDLQTGLKAMECPVLLIIDACHSAVAVPRLREFRPAVDYVTRSVTHENVGATVLSAAMSYETAGETAEQGHFTRGLLEGLKAGAGVPYDPYERRMYVHHLYAWAYGEVRHATKGKQNPFLNTPWTVPPLPLRDIPAR